MFKKFQTNEKGYLLLENLVTLSMLLAILLLLYPMVADWLVQRDYEKQKVEQARLLYESSMTWSPAFHEKQVGSYLITNTPTSVSVTHHNRNFEVEIYEVNFE